MTKTLLALCGVAAAITVFTGITTGSAHAGDGPYGSSDDWTRLHDDLETAGGETPDVSEPPAAPVEPPVDAAPSAPAVDSGATVGAPQNAAAAPNAAAAVQLPNTGTRSPGVTLPLAALVLAFLGSALVGTARSVRSPDVQA